MSGIASVAAPHDKPMTPARRIRRRQVAETYAQNAEMGTCRTCRVFHSRWII